MYSPAVSLKSGLRGMIFCWVCFSLTDFWVAYVFSPINAGNLDSLPFVHCVMLPWFHFEIGAIVLPLVWVAMCVQLPFGVAAELFWPC